jgi:hypothetical protein
MINTHATSVHQHQNKKTVQVCVNIKNYSVALILFYFGDKFMLFLWKFLRKLCFFNKQIATFVKQKKWRQQHWFIMYYIYLSICDTYF